MSSCFTRKPKIITFEADENLFAEFIAFKQTSKNSLSLGYVTIDHGCAYYKPLKETEVVKILNSHILILQSRIDGLIAENNRNYSQIKELKESKSETPIPKKRKWF